MNKHGILEASRTKSHQYMGEFITAERHHKDLHLPENKVATFNTSTPLQNQKLSLKQFTEQNTSRKLSSSKLIFSPEIFEKNLPLIQENNTKIQEQITKYKKNIEKSYFPLDTEEEGAQEYSANQKQQNDVLYNGIFKIQSKSCRTSKESSSLYQFVSNQQTASRTQNSLDKLQQNQPQVNSGHLEIFNNSFVLQNHNNYSLPTSNRIIQINGQKTSLREVQLQNSKFVSGSTHHHNNSVSTSNNKFKKLEDVNLATSPSHNQSNPTFFGTTSKLKSSKSSVRDIAHILGQSALKSEQNQQRSQFKMEQNLHSILSPRSSNIFPQKMKTSLYDIRKNSFPDLKQTKNSISANQKNSSSFKALHTSQYFQNGNQMYQHQSFQELPSLGSMEQDQSAYSLKNYFPSNFLEEFLNIIRDVNLGGNLDEFNTHNMNTDNKLEGAQVIKAVHSEIQNILSNQKTGAADNCVRSSLSELAVSLKRAHPNLFSEQPSGRADVQVLQGWLEGILSGVQADKYSKIEDKFQRVDDALILSFNELVRQESYQCKERGKLMLNVFSCYFSLIKKITNYETDERRKLKLQNEHEKLVMMKNVDDDIESKMNQIASLKEFLSIEQNKSVELEKELKLAEEREKTVFAKYDKLKGFNDIAKIQFIKMKKEIEDLRSRLSTKEVFQKKKLEKVLVDYKQTFKRQFTNSMYTQKAQEQLEEADQKLWNCLTELTSPPPAKEIEDIDDRMQISFSEIIQEAEERTRMVSNEVIIKQAMEEKSTALICQEMQTDPYLSLTYNKSIKVQTDLSFVDKKFDKVFSTKQKVEEYIRETQLKSELLQLEDIAVDQMDTSLDQEIQEENQGAAAGNQKNPEKLILSNIFAGLPIKKIKKKISKNNLQKFLENMGVLYNYLKSPDLEVKDTKAQNNNKNLKKRNSISGNNELSIEQKIIKSIAEIQEVDEMQEDHDSQSLSQLQSSSQQAPKIQNITKRGSIIAASLSVFQEKDQNIQKPIKQGSIKDMKFANQKVQMNDNKEVSELKESIKQTLEMTSESSSSTTSDLVQVIQRQQLIIEKLQNLALGESTPDNSFNESSKQLNPSFSLIANTNTQEIQSMNIIKQSHSLFSTQEIAQQPKEIQLQVPPSKNKIMNTMQSANLIGSPQKKAIQFIASIGQKPRKSFRAMQSSKKDDSQNFNAEELPNFNAFYGTKNTGSTSLGIIDKDDDDNNSLDNQIFLQADLEQPGEYKDNEFKQQVLGILQLYNMEIEKNANLRESLEELIKILRDLYMFAKLLFVHIKKTQKHTHKSIIEGFIQQFTSLKWKLPKEFDNNFEKEVLKEDKDDKKSVGLKFSSKRSAQRFIAHVQKSQAFTKMSIFDKNSHFGFIVANRIREHGIPKKFASFLPLKNTLKYITNLIDERVRMIREKRLPMDQDMPIFTFNKFLQIFGFRRVAESKYTQFLLSILHYQSIFRVNMFARLLTITNDRKANYSTDEMEKYFTAYEFIVNLSTMGVINPQHSETDSTHNVALLKAMDFLKSILEKIMPVEDISDLRFQLDAIKEIDQKSANKIFMVDFDVFMSKMLAKYRLLMQRTQLFVKNAFYAADLDGNERINLNEFLTLFRHIMPNKFNLMKCIKMFEEKADVITEDQKNLSFDKFTALCIDFNLFTTQMQDKYIQVNHKEQISQQIENLKKNWSEEYKKLADKIEILKPYVISQSYKNWLEIIQVLGQRLNQNSISDETQRPILLAHKLLNDELMRLIEEGKKGNEDAEDDDDEEDNDLFNLQDDDDNELSSLLKAINNKNNNNNNNSNQHPTVIINNSIPISSNHIIPYEENNKDAISLSKTIIQKM